MGEVGGVCLDTDMCVCGPGREFKVQTAFLSCVLTHNFVKSCDSNKDLLLLLLLLPLLDLVGPVVKPFYFRNFVPQFDI